MTRILQIAFLGIAVLVLGGCKKSKCWKGYGNDAAETRILDPFHTVEIYNNLEVIIVKDTVYQANVQATENIIPFINTEVKDGVLTLTDDNRCDFVRGYDKARTVTISVPTLEHVLCYNSGNVIIEDTMKTGYFTFEHWSASGTNQILVDADTVDIKLHTGTGDLTAYGSTSHLFIYASSYGFTNCYNLEAQSAWVTVRSSGDAYVNVEKRLRTFTHSRADIFVLGNPPSVSSEGDGSGNLIFE